MCYWPRVCLLYNEKEKSKGMRRKKERKKTVREGGWVWVWVGGWVRVGEGGWVRVRVRVRVGG